MVPTPRILVIAALALLGPSCAIGAKSSAAALPPAAPVVHVGMREYLFDLSREVPGGRVVFDVENQGAVDHALTFVVLADDFPPIQEQVRGDVRRGTPTLARVPALSPGERSTFAVDLKPGRYALLCFVVDRDGVTHAVKGQTAEFRVG